MGKDGTPRNSNNLENAGFKKEGTLRKAFFSRGEWIDTAVFSILREEWKEPKILTRKT